MTQRSQEPFHRVQICETCNRRSLPANGPEKEIFMFGKAKSLRELFEIRMSYADDCEKKRADTGLPKMIEKAGSSDLRSGLEHHLRETRTHVTRLERVFTAIGKEPDTTTNEIFDKMSGAVKDSISHIEDS